MEATASPERGDEPCVTTSVSTEQGRTVVSLFGEHDISTAPALSVQLDREADSDADLIVDLSHLDFMDASTIRTIVHATALLHPHHALRLRSPSSSSSRLLEICHLSELVDPAAADALHQPGALASWVGVPARGTTSAGRVDVGRMGDLPADAQQLDDATGEDDAEPADAEPLDGSRELSHGGG
ncbi:MAG: STAS domain-containing protein [Microthrixaceae bacterium]